MASATKFFALVFILGFASAVNAAEKVAEPVPLSVESAGSVAVPIIYTAENYEGPYDPLDPKGVAAAMHRATKIGAQQSAEVVKSYVPPGVGKLVKKEAIKIAINEGKRFALSHPKETAELIGIATKSKALYDTAAHKLKNLEKKEAKAKAAAAAAASA